MVDVIALQQELTSNSEKIVKILETLGYNNIRDRGKYLQFPNHNGDNLTACSILKSTLQYQNFSHGERGNLFTLIMKEKNLSFPECLDYISRKLHLQFDIAHVKYPFGGFYLKLDCSHCDRIEQLESYDEASLPDKNNYSYKFLLDGISVEVQEEWGVRYCHEENSILIPIYDQSNRLVGCKSRNNDNKCDLSNRWWAFLPYSKTGVVYGINKNYISIAKHNTVVIFESEKSVLQCASFDFFIAVAIGGHCFSEQQCQIINSLLVDNVIVAFDEGLTEDEIKYEANKLVINTVIRQNRVGYIFDENHEYLAEKSKDSPSDNGPGILEGLIKNCVRWING